jgi:uncharacterized protein YjbI with pentapeptide repeats
VNKYSFDLNKLVALNAPIGLTDLVFERHSHSDISLTAMQILIDFKPYMQWFFDSGILPNDALEYQHFNEDNLMGIHLKGASLAYSQIKRVTGKSQYTRNDLNEKWRSGIADISLIDCDLCGLKEEDGNWRVRNEFVYDFSGSRISSSEYMPRYTVARECRGGFYCPDQSFFKIDFTGSDLRESSLYRGSMREVILKNCNLTKCYFARAILTDVDFEGAKAKKVNFRAVLFQGSINLEKATVNKCNFYDASFENGYIPPENSKNVDGKMLG